MNADGVQRRVPPLTRRAANNGGPARERTKAAKRRLLRTSLAIACIAFAVTAYETWRVRAASGELASTKREQENLRRGIDAAEARLQAGERRLAAVEADNGRLIEAIASGAITDPARAARPRLTRESIKAAYERAQELESEGDWTAALAAYLRCYDTPYLRTPDLIRRVARLGGMFPPARDALRERRAQAEQLVLASADDVEAVSDYIALNSALNDDVRSLELYDRLAKDDVRRDQLARGVFNALVTLKRYRDALRVMPYDRWLGELESSVGREQTRYLREQAQRDAIKARAATKEHEQAMELARQRSIQAQRKAAVISAALGIEITAGAGQLVQARELAEKLLGFDGSAETRALLQIHLERAGQPELLQQASGAAK